MASDDHGAGKCKVCGQACCNCYSCRIWKGNQADICANCFKAQMEKVAVREPRGAA